MFRRYLDDGAIAIAAGLDRLTKLLGRPPRAYRDFAAEAAKSWESSGGEENGLRIARTEK